MKLIIVVGAQTAIVIIALSFVSERMGQLMMVIQETVLLGSTQLEKLVMIAFLLTPR